MKLLETSSKMLFSYDIKRFVLLLFVALYIPVLSTCGITSILLLEPAIISKPQGQTEVVQIDHNTANTDPSFKGYNIYYKIYKNSDTSKITSDKNYLTDSTRAPSESILTSRNYRPISFVSVSGNSFSTVSKNPDIKPNLQNLSSPYTVYIDVSAGTNNYPPIRDESNKTGQLLSDASFTQGINNNEFHVLLYNATENNTLIIRRETSPPKGFFNGKNGTKAYEDDDEDIKKMLGSKPELQDDTVLKVIFAVIPFGIDFTLAQQAYGNIILSQEITIDYTRVP